MVIITHQRDKCIGCNYCVELAFDRWRMSRKDGKCNLLGSEEKRGFHTVRVSDEEYEANVNAAKACPVKIIQVKKIWGISDFRFPISDFWYPRLNDFSQAGDL